MMSLDRFYQSRRLNDEAARITGFNPYYPEIQCGLSDPVRIDGSDFINLASNNYLGLANDPRVINAAVNGLEKYGISLCSTPVSAGYTDIYKETEERLAAFEKLDDVLILPSCYQANNGIFSIMAGRDDLVIVDRCAHSSLIEGIRASACKIRPFLHNDLNHLEDILKKSTAYSQVFVVTESVFSTEGCIAPFRQIYDLCMKHQALAVVDDSHGIGVIGAHGRGILEYSGIIDYQGLYLASLGKALAVMGGMIAGKSSLIRFLRYNMPHLLYSTALIPSAMSAVLKVLDIIKDEYGHLSSVLSENTARLRDALSAMGYLLTPSGSPIVSMISGNTLETLLLARAMHEHRLIGTPFIYPSVKETEGRMRLIAGAGLGSNTIGTAIREFGKIRGERP